MQTPLEYGFDEQLVMSQGYSETAQINEILLSNIPSALAVVSAHSDNDRHGTDFWVECKNGKFLSVDCKVREQDWAPKGYDDVALETWSVVEKRIPGWTRDKEKQTDYVLWLWKDTGRWMLVPFQMLLGVFENCWVDWSSKHKTAKQFTPRQSGGYHSECVFVPRREVWGEIYRQYGGA
jgi:hypothetical protein